jgi:bifunctional non-homologous end joining protein LigD
MAQAKDEAVLEIGGREVVVTNSGKLLIPEAGVTKLDLVNYYLAVADGALRGAGGRPCVLVRYPNGIADEFFFQKRAPAKRPDWLEVAEIRFPSGRTAEEVVPRHAADLGWMANLACLELHPHPVRAEDLDHPDELRVDLDPVPGVEWPQIRQVAHVVHEVLTELGLKGWPKTSGSRGIHVLVRIQPRWTFDEVRRCALALAREVERRAPQLATSKWWKEERQGVFVDYNQNAKDRTVASAYSVRPKPDARVSAPVSWKELDACEPADFTLWTMPKRFAKIGDPHAAIDDAPCSLEPLLELSRRQEAEGHGDAPWPPHYRKAAGEPPRKPPAARKPLIEVARADRESEAIAAAEAWKAEHPKVAQHLAPADVLVDRMRGSSSLWYRVRINLEHVPARLRPKKDPAQDGKPTLPKSRDPKPKA